MLLALPGSAAAQGGPILSVNGVTAAPIEGEASCTVTVADSAGQLVTGLAAEDFAASQDGTDVALDSAAVAERPAAIVLVVDISAACPPRARWML